MTSGEETEINDPVVIRLIGVYDANGSLRGEVAYWVGARLGRRHCSLCDVTHGAFTEKREWRNCRESLPVPFDTYHRDDQPESIRRATGDRAPVVVAETDSDLVILLTGDEIAIARGDPARFAELIEDAMRSRGLEWQI
ncbi:MAG: hypothetical protein RL547_1613 [Actinomycetota bacterium]